MSPLDPSVLASIPQADVPRPKDSALGVVLRRNGGTLETLVGRRSRDSRFMPGHLAFPGGRLDPEDDPGSPGAFARCASREFAEETTLRIEPDRWIDLDERITPPMFPVRFRTRFLMAEFPAGQSLPDEPPSPREVDRLLFASPGRILADWASGTALVPPPVLPVLRCLREHPGEDLQALAVRLREVNRLEQATPRIEFMPDVWVVPVHTHTVPPATHTNVWMPGGERFAILDPGSPRPREIDRLLRVIERRRQGGAEPAAVLLTHAHPDHVGGVPAVCHALGVPLRAHPAAYARLPDVERIEWQPIEDGERIDLGGLELVAHHTPGHAPDHLAYGCPERGLLFAGDLLSGLSTILVLPPPEGDMGLFLDSLGRMAQAGYRRLLPGHGPPLPGKALNRVIEHRRMREERVTAALARAGSAALGDLAAAAYEDTRGVSVLLTEMQTRAHLEHLAVAGRVRERNDGTWEAV